MIRNEYSKIISEEYADYIVDYRTNPQIAEQFPGAALYDINDTYAVIHIPVSLFKNRTFRASRIAIVPDLFGLASEVSLEASGIFDLRNIPDLNLRGGGVLVGIIDTGINYQLPSFIKEDGTTKIYSIWDQTIQSDEGAPFQSHFGTEYSAQQINEALKAENPNTVVPSKDENGHGTMMAAIAAGNDERKAGFFGVAPDAGLVIVKLAQAKKYLRNFYAIPEGVVCYQENNIMWGIEYCLEAARQFKKPIALCIGIGTTQSAHDGTSPLAQLLDAYAQYPRVGVVTAAGNEGNLGRHFHAKIDPAVGSTIVELNIDEKDKNFSMQLWGESPGIYSIDIMSPSGEYVPRISADLHVNRKISFIFEKTEINVEYQTVELQTGDELIIFNFKNVSSGLWKFTVYIQGNLSGDFNIWLPMGNFISKDTYFITPDIYTTVVDPGNAASPITVTAYNPVGDMLYVNASRGYTRSNFIKPDLAAPGVNYLAPNLNGEYVYYTGTGVAAAHTAGVVALSLEWGIIKGNQPSFNTVEIKKYYIRGAKRSKNLTYPNREWGFGILQKFNALDVLRESLLK